ncbi:MAG: 1-acyl-sn-glycerol-3-phosphate acyltransferase [Deltaproteobacteria bacterium]|nr:1-acyl-sn-glycerol-3-phosphate acyltransferase [Deltaproteobacteria bacterium]
MKKQIAVPLKLLRFPSENLKNSGMEVPALRQELNAHIEKLKGQFEDSIHRFQKDLKNDLKKTRHLAKNTKKRAEIEDLTLQLNQLEKKIQSLGQLKSSQTLIPPQASMLKKLNFVLSNFFSFRTYKRLLFGVQRFDKIDFDDFGRDPSLEKKLKPFFDFLYHKYWRVKVEGVENIPNQGRALIVANHSGTLPFDGAMIRLAVTNDHPAARDVRFLVEDFVYYLPFLGTLMYRIGGVRACPENAERLLKANHLVTVFPEGEKGIGKSYKQRYHLQRFGRGGFIKIALKTKAPIIPVAVIGAEETHPLLYKTGFLAKPFGIPYVPITPTLPWLGIPGLLGLPAHWTLHFGKPISLEKYDSKALEDELLIHKLSEMVRQNIQEMIREGLKKRRSIWFG